MRTIKRGVRDIAFQASPYMRWAITWANIFIDCPTCDQSIGIKTDEYISDQEFLEFVRREGWAIIPGKHIACPKCRKNRRKQSAKNISLKPN